MEKACSRCKKVLPLTSEYYQINRQSNTGFRPDCKQCRKEIYREKKPEWIDHASYLASEGKKKCKRCQKCMDIDLFSVERRRADSLSSNCKECLAKERKDRRNADKEKFDAPAKAYKLKNKEKVRQRAAKYQRDRRSADGKFRMRGAITRLVNGYLKRRGSKKSARFFQHVGYTREDLAIHLEKQFTNGMSWDNYGEWHVDHIIPNSSFDYESMNDKSFIECWSLSNLRPMWASDNLKKGNATLFLV